MNVNEDLNINKDIIELIEYLKYIFVPCNKINSLFIINNKYQIQINMDKIIEITYFNISENLNYNNYNVILLIDEDLLIELYKNGITVKNILLFIKDGTIKTKKFNPLKLYNFIKNFDLSTEKWKEFYLQYKY